MSKYIDAAEVARMIRKHLKATFPGTTFSVRTSKYAGGASVRVAYVDGPALADVERVAGKFAGASFDGMTDTKSYHEDIIATDAGIEAVRFGADFVFVDRTYSPEFLRRVVDHVATEYHATETPVVRVSEYDGHGHLDTIAMQTSPIIGGGFYQMWDVLVNRAAQEMAA